MTQRRPSREAHWASRMLRIKGRESSTLEVSEENLSRKGGGGRRITGEGRGGAVGVCWP